MELRRLSYFVALADELHFTRAAERLAISQPNLSKQIQELERDYGVTLIQRLGRQVHLTTAGQDLLRGARRLLADAEDIRRMMADHRGMSRGRIVIGSMVSASVYLLPQVAAAFRQQFPGVELVIETGHSSDLYAGLLENRIDLALAYAPLDESQLETQPLYTEELLLAVPADHPFAGRETLPVRELAAMPLMLAKDQTCRRIIDRSFREAGISLQPALEMGSLEGLRTIVEMGQGATLLPRMYLRRFAGQAALATVRLVDPVPSEAFGLIRHRDRRLCAGMRALITLITGEAGRLADPDQAPTARQDQPVASAATAAGVAP